jgi:acetyl esterase/lipase
LIAIALRLLAAIMVIAIVAMGGLYLYSPPKSLDVLDALFPGEPGVARVATAVGFGSDGQQLDIWSKPGGSKARKPVLIFFYGGGWAKGRRQDYGFVGRAYAARGFVVVIPDYRKVPAVHFPSFIADGAEAARWVHDNIARFGGDPGSIVLAGHSAGGYIAMMLALDRRYLIAAGVDPGSVRAVVGLAGPYDFYPFTAARAVVAMGQAPDPTQTQPISFARRDAPPLWLATGTADREVRPRNAIALAARQHALGSLTTVLRQYPGLSHNDLIMAISRPFRHKAPVLDDSIAFIASHLTRKPPETKTEIGK